MNLVTFKEKEFLLSHSILSSVKEAIDDIEAKLQKLVASVVK